MDRIDRMPQAKQRAYDIFSEAEIAALCSLPLLDGALMQILFDTGIRKSEAIKLRLRDFRPIRTPKIPHGEIVVLAGKGGNDRVIPATAAVERAINELATLDGLDGGDYLWYATHARGETVRQRSWSKVVRHKPIGSGTFHSWWDRSIEASGVHRRNPHMTRHTFANRWLRRGGRLETLSIAMGHSSLSITADLYGHLDTSDIAEDMALFEDFSKISVGTD
jgi:integrase